jgi:hypothetical protein
MREIDRELVVGEKQVNGTDDGSLWSSILKRRVRRAVDRVKI